MKSSGVIKRSGQGEDGSAPASGARWVVLFTDKYVARCEQVAEQAAVKTMQTFIYQSPWVTSKTVKSFGTLNLKFFSDCFLRFKWKNPSF